MRCEFCGVVPCVMHKTEPECKPAKGPFGPLPVTKVYPQSAVAAASDKPKDWWECSAPRRVEFMESV